MAEERTICTLNYLVGTLATAYRGRVSSLVLRDFCILEQRGGIVFKGTIIAMPEGNYQASLIHEGIEVSRGAIHDGYFEVRSDPGLVEKARNLQIDVIQNGRHIGTFLLKKEQKEGVFVSALELSEEVGDVNLGQLAGMLHEKAGLLRKADDIISRMLSTKQDWPKFSEKLHSFAHDLFWFDRNAFYAWYDVLVRWCSRACEGIGRDSKHRAVSNLLTLLELPLGEETDHSRLEKACHIWVDDVAASSIDLSADLIHARKLLARLHEVFPGIDIAQVMKMLFRSLHAMIMKAPVLSNAVLAPLKGLIPEEDFSVLSRHDVSQKKDLLKRVDDADFPIERRTYGDAFEVIEAADAWLSKDGNIISVFFEVVDRNLTEQSAGVLAKGLMRMCAIFGGLSPELRNETVGSITHMLSKLANLGRNDLCDMLLDHIDRHETPLRTDITLNAEVASTVLATGDGDLFNHYLRMLDTIIIPPPGIRGLSYETWAEIADPLHLTRLSKFLDILKLGTGPFRHTLIRVICNLYAGDVFIPDDRIFQREVSKYLNSGTMKNSFLLHRILLRKLPVYFYDIGATGMLRDDTTDIDSWGNDTVLYFLRKQVHVNSSNRLIHVTEEIMRSWVFRDLNFVKDLVPADILKGMDEGLLDIYSSVMQELLRSAGAMDEEGLHFERMLEVPEDEVERRLSRIETTEEVRKKVFLILRVYAALVKKYSLVSKGDFSGEIDDRLKKLEALREIILSPAKTIPQESLYFKRHIAFGIPSVLGSFHEAKFDALAETTSLEEKVRAYLENSAQEIREKGNGFTAEDLGKWLHSLRAAQRLLELQDLGNFQMKEVMVMLGAGGLFYSQIADVLRVCQHELIWIVDFLHATFHDSLMEVLDILPRDRMPGRLRSLSGGGIEFANRAADIVTRDIMSGIAGLLELDNLLDSLIDALGSRVKEGRDETFGAMERPKESFYLIDMIGDDEAMKLSAVLGNKAKNLIYLSNGGLPVPAGAVLPLRHSLNYRDYVGSAEFRQTLGEAVSAIEKRTSGVFGSTGRPIFLSVRSGSYISMPGILSSILYCGINDGTVHGFIENTGKEWLAWDSYRRFIEQYGSIVLRLDMDLFDGMSDDFLKQNGVTKTEDLTAGQMKEIVLSYRNGLRKRGLLIPDDVFEQLRQCAKAVYASWHTERAIQFRKAMGISEHWGTSVTLMHMIYGNDAGSGASVFFTRKPFSYAKGIYGETRERATGSELVHGRSLNQPITREQAFGGRKSLEETDPELFRMHEDLASRIETTMRGLPQEVEVTYTKQADGQRIIYVLQTRRMEFHRGFVRRFDDVCRMESHVIGRGTGVFGGALSGVATFSGDPVSIREIKKERNLPVILLRKEASTDDVMLMPEADGIVTATGGATSHAAVLAQKFNVTAIVGCSDMKILKEAEGRPTAMIGDFSVEEGSELSIDGSTGIVYAGLCADVTQEP